jgi:hypothetical protein
MTTWCNDDACYLCFNLSMPQAGSFTVQQLLVSPSWEHWVQWQLALLPPMRRLCSLRGNKINHKKSYGGWQHLSTYINTLTPPLAIFEVFTAAQMRIQVIRKVRLSLGEHFPFFWRTTVYSCSGSSSPWTDSSTLQTKAQWSLEPSHTIHQTTKLHSQEDLNPWIYYTLACTLQQAPPRVFTTNTKQVLTSTEYTACHRALKNQTSHNLLVTQNILANIFCEYL